MAQKVKNKVNKQSINHYSESFKLLRRFRNFLRKDVVSFQQIRLLYMAFSKAAIEKKLDANSKYYELYKQANEAVVKMYQKADEKKDEYKDSGFNIIDTESNIYKKIDDLINSKQIDIGVRLTKRFVNMINTKPDKAKAKRLLTSIDNAIKNKRLMNDNRLYQQVIHAKEELQDYLGTGDTLEVVDYVGKKKGKKEKPKTKPEKKTQEKSERKPKKEKSSNEKLKDDILATAKKYGITFKGMSAPNSNKSYVLQNLEDELGIDLDLWDAGDHLVLSKIAIQKNKRGSGIGSKAMQKIINFADAQGKDIRLTPSKDFGASSVSRLKKFYKKFGFVNKPKSDFSSKETMIRYAQGMNAPTYNGH